MRMSDWSSDVCSSDLGRQSGPPGRIGRRRCRRGGRVMSVWISGAGTSHFGKQPDLSVAELAWQAIGEALDAEGADATRPFDAVFVGSVFGEHGVAMRVLQGFDITGVPIVTVENACRSEGRRLGKECDSTC